MNLQTASLSKAHRLDQGGRLFLGLLLVGSLVLIMSLILLALPTVQAAIDQQVTQVTEQGQVSPAGSVVYGERLTYTVRYEIAPGDNCSDLQLQVQFDGPPNNARLPVAYLSSGGPFTVTSCTGTPAVAPVTCISSTVNSDLRISCDLGAVNNSSVYTYCYDLPVTVQVWDDGNSSTNRSVRYVNYQNFLDCDGSKNHFYNQMPVVNLAQPSLSLDKTSDPPASQEIGPGDWLTHTVTLDNLTGSRQATAYRVLITDILPTNVSLVDIIPPPSTTLPANVVTWYLPSLAPGDSVLYQLRYTLPLTQNVAHNPILDQVEAEVWSLPDPTPESRRYVSSDTATNYVQNAEIGKSQSSAVYSRNTNRQAVAGELVTITIPFTIPRGTIIYNGQLRVLLGDGLEYVGPIPPTPTQDNIKYDQLDPEAMTGNFTQVEWNVGHITNTDWVDAPRVYKFLARPRRNYFLGTNDNGLINHNARLPIQPILRWSEDVGAPMDEHSPYYFVTDKTNNNTVSVVFIRPDLEKSRITHHVPPSPGGGNVQVVFDLVAENVNNRPVAYDTVMTATLGPGLTFVTATHPLPAYWAALPDGRTVISWTLDPLSGGAPWTAYVTATLPTTFVVGTHFTASVDFRYETFDATVEAEGVYTTGVRSNYEPCNSYQGRPNGCFLDFVPGIQHQKVVDPNDNVAIGDSIVYTLTTDVGANVRAYSPFYTDTLPAGFLWKGDLQVTGITLTSVYSNCEPGGGGQEALRWQMDDFDTLGGAPMTVTAVYHAELSALDCETGDPLYASAGNMQGRVNADNEALLSLYLDAAHSQWATLDEIATARTKVVQPYLATNFGARRIYGTGDLEIGEEAHFEITFENRGYGVAYDINLCDELPQGMAYVTNSTVLDNDEWTAAQVVVAPPGGDEETICWVVSELGGKDGGVKHLALQYDAVVLETAVAGLWRWNDARLLDYSSQPGGTNDGDQDDQDLPPGIRYDRHYGDFVDAIPPNAQCGAPGCPFDVLGLWLHKTASVLQVAPAQSLMYTVTYGNSSLRTPLTGVVLTDTYDANLTYTGYSGPTPPTHDPANHRLIWNLGSLPAPDAGGTIVIYFDVNAPLDPATDTALVNQVDIRSNERGVRPEPVLVTTTLIYPNLWLTKSSAPATEIEPGQQVVYTLDYGNDGAAQATATQVELYDTLPEEANFVSASAGGQLVGHQVVWSLGDYAPGASGAVQLTVTVDAPLPYDQSSIINFARIDSREGVSATVYQQASVRLPDLSISQGYSLGPEVSGCALEGGQITYTINYTNAAGALTATNLYITDTFDVNAAQVITYQTTPPLADPVPVAGGRRWQVPSLAPGSSGQILVVVEVDDPFPAGKDQVTNTLTYASDQTNGYPENKATACVRQNEVDLRITKTAPNVVSPGGSIVYNLHVENRGHSATTNVVVTDRIPLDTIWVSGGTFQNGIVTFTPGNMSGDGDTWDGDFTVQVDAGLPNCSPILNDDYAVKSNEQTTPAFGPAVVTLVEEPPDLTAAKTDTPDPVQLGGTLLYQLQYSYSGCQPTTNAVLNDTLSPDVTLLQALPSPDSVVGQQLTWNLGTLAAQDQGSILLSVRVDGPPAGGAIYNLYDVDSDLTSYHSYAEPTLVETGPSPALSISKSDAPDPVLRGETLMYSIQYTNTGGGAATGVIITDVLPADVAASTVLPPPTTWQGQTLTWNLGVLPGGAGGSILIMGAVRDDASCNSTIINAYTIASDQTTPQAGSETTTVGCPDQPILTLSKSDQPDPVAAGGRLTYTLTYANAGFGPASNVVIEDLTPVGFTPVSVQPLPSQQNGQSYTWTLGTLNAGEGDVITIVGDVDGSLPHGAILANVYTIASDQTGSETNAESTQVVRTAYLTLDKAAWPDEVLPGGRITYTLTVANTGGQAANNVILQDQVPVSTTLVSPPGGGDPVVWNLGTIQAGGQQTVEMVVQVDDPTGATTIHNVALVSSDETDPVSQDITTAVYHPAPALSLAKSGPADAGVGSLLTYTLVLSNTGDAEATGVVISDLLPAYTSFVSASDGGALVGDTVVWDIGVLPAGQDRSRTLVVRADQCLPAATETVMNGAFAASAETGQAPSNLAKTTLSTAPALALVKAGPGWTYYGDPVTYTLTITNVGGISATNVIVTDPLPADATFVAASDNGQLVGSQVIWNLGDLACGLSRPLTLTVQAPLSGTDSLVNHAQAAAQGTPAAEAEPVTTTLQSATLAIVKTGPPEAAPGALVTYTLVVSNISSGPLAGVLVTDPLPANTTFIQATGGGVLVNSQVLWDLGALALGEARTLTMVVQLDACWPTTSGALANSAQARVAGSAPVGSVPVETALLLQPSLTLDKVGAAQAAPGGLLTYTLAVTNGGDVLAQSLLISDSLPAHTTFVTATAGGALVGDWVQWNVGTLACSEALDVQLVVRVDDPLPAPTITVTNRACALLSGWTPICDAWFSTATTTGSRIYLPLVLKNQ